MKLLIISGRSGSGKSTVLHILEDRGYYCIDNLPASLLPSLADRLISDSSVNSNIAVSIDARNIYVDLQKVPTIIEQLKQKALSIDIIFLDANSQTLLRRFSESRRKHPLSDDRVGLREAIDKETELLEAISLMASVSIDTSSMTLHELRDAIKSRIVEQSDTGLALLFQSFGFKNGVPVDADIVYDVRCLPNPYWETALRALTGLDQKVVDYLDSQQEVQHMLADIKDYLQKWLPRFEENNRSYITVALGCTGGQHRSVYLCEKLGSYFQDHIQNVQVRHRELPG
ncbi:MAG: RNase adapter RapZ [Gammaproteobacteria bacterium]|nr:RNase adapter RapZ [Gammaproteobacteria bacterium]